MSGSRVISLLCMFSLGVGSYGQEARSSGTANHPDYEPITLTAGNGHTSSAAFFAGGTNVAVVFVPGAVFNKESWFELAGRLQRLKIASLSLDGKTPDDVLSAIALLKERKFGSIVLVGGSMGGAAVLGVLEKGVDERVSKVVLLAPAGGNPVGNPHISKFFIVASGDGLYGTVKRLCDDSSEPKKLLVLDGSEHAQHLFNGKQKDALSKAILDFISDGSP